MNIAFPYEDETEKRQHLNAIQMLARDMEVPVDEVRDLYDSELKKFRQDVKVREFLTVIVSRRVKEMIKNMIERGEFLQG